MPKLIPLSEIPHRARVRESEARKRYASKDEALTAAHYRILTAPGCHSESYFDPPVEGWVVTEQAAIALCAVPTRMPDNSVHYRRVWDLYE
jgi:hypothetical protein